MSNLVPAVLFFTALCIKHDDQTETVNIVIPNEVVAVTIEYRTHSVKQDVKRPVSFEEMLEFDKIWNDEERFNRKILLTKIHWRKQKYYDEQGNEVEQDPPVYSQDRITYGLLTSRKNYEIKRIWLWLKNGQKIQGINLGSANPTLPPLNTLPN